MDDSYNPFRAIGDKCRLSERTIRNAFSKQAIPYNTACKIAHAAGGIPIGAFRIKEDRRGKKKSAGK